ncbi:MAG TPA: endolytic transglycosylase MltG [Epulopiscium sp.]|nr:endolytic transglycosylase MltG [Candidatus Epulonipiscium sp.]
MDNKKGKGIPWYLRLFFNIIIVGILIFAVQTAYEIGFKSSYDIIVEQSKKQKDSNIKEVKIKVNKGASTEDIAEAVYAGGLISNKMWFRLQSKLFKFDGKYKEGVYSLNTTMDDKRIMTFLTTEKVAESESVRVTIPEGFNVMQIAARLEELDLVSQEDFLKAVNERDYEYEFLEDIDHTKKNKLEGYLFPDTYFFPEDVTAQEVVIRMLNRFEEITDKYKQELVNIPYSFDDVIIIASIIEQEAKLEEERAIISGVMYNRLADAMKLQMCSTVQYALEKKTANLSYDDLAVESPYNTYKYEGLPIGPICSPGEASLRAAFRPEEHDYYFFVLNDAESGSHAFSGTAEEHNSNKSKYKQSLDKNFHQ